MAYRAPPRSPRRTASCACSLLPCTSKCARYCWPSSYLRRARRRPACAARASASNGWPDRRKRGGARGPMGAAHLSTCSCSLCAKGRWVASSIRSSMAAVTSSWRLTRNAPLLRQAAGGAPRGSAGARAGGGRAPPGRRERLAWCALRPGGQTRRWIRPCWAPAASRTAAAGGRAGGRRCSSSVAAAAAPAGTAAPRPARRAWMTWSHSACDRKPCSSTARGLQLISSYLRPGGCVAGEGGCAALTQRTCSVRAHGAPCSPAVRGVAKLEYREGCSPWEPRACTCGQRFGWGRVAEQRGRTRRRRRHMAPVTQLACQSHYKSHPAPASCGAPHSRPPVPGSGNHGAGGFRLGDGARQCTSGAIGCEARGRRPRTSHREQTELARQLSWTAGPPFGGPNTSDR